MVKRGSTTFSATKVAKAGLAATAALTRILELEKEVGRLRHHVSVLSKRIHVMGKEAEKERENDGAEVASPVRVQEPEPQVVAEPEVRMKGIIVAEEEEDLFVASVAKPAVAESRVALDIDEPEVALVRLPKGKRRRTSVVEEDEETTGSEAEEVVEGQMVATSVPRKPRGMVVVAGAPVGPSSGQFGRGVVNPNFPMFVNRSRGFPGDRGKRPAGGGRGYR